MNITYKDKKVEKICNDEKAMMKFFPKQTQCYKLMNLMTKLRNLSTLSFFKTSPTLRQYRFHNLIGNKEGIYSLSIDYSYRMELILEIENGIDGIDTIKILEVSNHYGD